MGFPDIHAFPPSRPGAYELQMGDVILRLLRLFAGRVPDPESNAHVLELAGTPLRWSAAHFVFDEVRARLLAAMLVPDPARCAQYFLEESCLQALYNATLPRDPFDPSSPFFVPLAAVALARVADVPVAAVVDVLAPQAPVAIGQEKA